MGISKGSSMVSAILAARVIVGDATLAVCLVDGRQVSVPFRSFPRLEAATPQQRVHVEMCAGGRMLRWPEIDEDIEVRHIVEGRLPVKGLACVSAVAETPGTYVARPSERRVR